MDMILIYIPCTNPKEARKIGTYLLKHRLCACINIIPSMSSICFWPPKTEKLEEANEAILIVKTLDNKFTNIEKEVKTIHSSDTPCIIAIPVLHASKKYYEWVQGEIK